MEILTQLKKDQKIYLQKMDLENLNKTNKKIYEIMETIRKQKEQAREQAREQKFIQKIWDHLAR